ncbi:ornithine carbamoyltransferase [Alphaproteobacteria bacterium]|jgi:ornithine carbamoyltransferase|nr:ornithine carbamoyltransferase [Alphaproteobacteria bacterium]MBT5799096.1 ornithine carbamoyltransferase [Alphaproteobacteria bacterium]MDC0394262.1 ornithine carbamoyltransferase [Alphaproteobacteria bacterium]
MSANFIDIVDFEPSELSEILSLAHKMKAGHLAPTPLQGKSVAMIFEKHSTRTRISFEVGITQLGGSAIVLSSNDMQFSRGESIADTAKVLSRYVDAVMIRSLSHDTVLELAQYGDIPVINGLTNLSHPCQIMADLMTIEERFQRLNGLTISWFGDSNNVLKSWVDAAIKFPFALRIASPKAYQPDLELINKARDLGAQIDVYEGSREAAIGANVLVTDVWISMGDNEGTRMQDLKPYQVNEELLSLADDKAIFLHCLPAIRGDEVTAGVIDGPQSAVFDEAENRLHAQKAILCHLFGSTG